MPRVSEAIEVRKVGGLFGVEIEVEGANLPEDNVEGWVKHNDGSLRGNFPTSSCENVFAQPASLEVAKKRIADLAAAHANSKLKFSFRTSVHVHMNVQDLLHGELSALVYLHVLLEPMLVRYCGSMRVNNRFCLRSLDAQAYLDDVHILVRSELGYSIQRINKEYRYSALNLASLPKYGSVEFRAMRGTMDLEVLGPWLDMLLALKTAARKFKNPQAVNELFTQLSFKEFVVHIFGPDLYAKLTYEGEEDEAILQHSISCEIPYRYVNYDVEVKPEKKAKAVPPKINWGEVQEVLAPAARRRAIRVDVNPVGQWDDPIEEEQEE